MLINYLVQDEPDLARWQSGILTAAGDEKPSYQAFELPLTVKSHSRTSTTLWGQIRPGSGSQPYVLEELQRQHAGCRSAALRARAPAASSPESFPRRPARASACSSSTRGLASSTVTAG